MLPSCAFQKKRMQSKEEAVIHNEGDSFAIDVDPPPLN